MKAVSFTPAATRQWLKLSPDIRKRIDAKLTVYATNGSGDVRRLRGAPGAAFELATGALFSSNAEINHRRRRRQPQRDLRLKGKRHERAI